jgi:hypothetical protein
MTDRPLYVCIPRKVATNPPIRHRVDRDKVRVTPFQFAVLAGVLYGAWAARRAEHHAKAMQAGDAAVKVDR